MKAISHQIIRWLPHLRRHAHALTGSRTRGDSYVMACLSVISVEPQRMPADGDVRLELYKLFHTIWQMVDREYPLTEAGPDIDELVLCQGLAELPPLHRQILLLAGMEGFSVGQVAAIIDVSEALVAQGLAEARTQIAGSLEYIVPLDLYRQTQPRRAVQRPSPRRQAAASASPARPNVGERPSPLRAWSWQT